MSGKKIAIINYGMGNLNSVRNAFSLLGATPVVTDEPQEIEDAAALVLPGVGAFGEAISNLRQLGLVDLLTRRVIEKKVPFLGICLGMQLLAESSTENGVHQGLGWIKGAVVKLEGGEGIMLPHVGWNNVSVRESEPVFLNILNESDFFFDHTFHLQADDSDVVGTCSYGQRVVAAIRHDNIIATQFHPEKSQSNGLRILRNFLNFALG